MKKICKEQYEKDFKEMFKLDKNGLMTDIDCYVSNLENKINNLQSKIDKAIEILGQYKHLSSPTEEQANEQEEIVSNAYDILKEDK